MVMVYYFPLFPFRIKITIFSVLFSIQKNKEVSNEVPIFILGLFLAAQNKSVS